MIMAHLNSTDYVHERYTSLLENEKQRLAEYRKNSIIKPLHK